MQTKRIQIYSRNTRPHSLPSKCNSPIYPTIHSIFIESTKPIGRKNMLEPEVYYGPAGWPQAGWMLLMFFLCIVTVAISRRHVNSQHVVRWPKIKGNLKLYTQCDANGLAGWIQEKYKKRFTWEPQRKEKLILPGKFSKTSVYNIRDH